MAICDYKRTGAKPENKGENRMKTTITTEPAFQNIGNWIKGKAETENGTTYTFYAKIFDEGSEYGINQGKISKLEIRLGGETIVNYDRGWDIRPTKEVRPVYKHILEKFN
jgi:hypothetical protein